jgi:glycosyltransferase involved in cell wall biosynthesis
MNKENKTLVIISPAFPANESESYWVPSQQLLVKTLKKNFPNLNIIVLAYFYPYQRSVYEWKGINVISFGGRKLRLLVLFFRMLKTLGEIKKENNVIGLFSFWCREAALIGKWFGKWHKLKHFCWVCGQDARKTNKYVKWISPKPNELVAISDFISDEFYKNHRIKPSHIIPNAIDRDLFPTVQPQERDIDLLAVGSLIPLKRYDIFVSVIKKMIRRLPNIRAIICGVGEEKENIRTLIDSFDLNDHIRLLDAMPQEEVLKLMQRTKILVHASEYEGFSTVCLEALYSGAHVISFTKPMNHDIKNWYVVKTEEEMGEKSLELLLNRKVDDERILVYAMDDTAKAIMRLFQ